VDNVDKKQTSEAAQPIERLQSNEAYTSTTTQVVLFCEHAIKLQQPSYSQFGRHRLQKPIHDDG